MEAQIGQSRLSRLDYFEQECRGHYPGEGWKRWPVSSWDKWGYGDKPTITEPRVIHIEPEENMSSKANSQQQVHNWVENVIKRLKEKKIIQRTEKEKKERKEKKKTMQLPKISVTFHS